MDNDVLKVLLAEDDPVHRVFAARILEKEGHSVTVVADAQSAADRFRHEHFDVVLTKTQRSVASSAAAIALLRQHQQSRNKRSLIIALIDGDSNTDNATWLDAGADGCLIRPLRLAELKSLVQRVTASAVDSSTAPQSTNTCTSVRASQILRGTGNDRELASELIELFQHDLPTTLRKLESAVADEDLDTVKMIAHSLKSPLLLFGAVSACDESHKLEVAARESKTALVPPLYANLCSHLTAVSAALAEVDLSSETECSSAPGPKPQEPAGSAQIRSRRHNNVGSESLSVAAETPARRP